MRRVVITGIGLITPFGIGVAPTWQGLIEGHSGLAPIRSFNASSLRTQIAGEVQDFEPKTFVKNRRLLRLMTRCDRFAFAAASLALDDAGLASVRLDSDRTGLFLGSNKDISDPNHFYTAALESRSETGTVDPHQFIKSAYATVYPLFFVEGLPASSLFFLSEEHGLKGVNGFFIGTADASAVAVGRAYRAVRRGEADRCIAGGFDASVFWLNLIKLDALTVTTPRNDLGPEAYRPYDRDRSGCVIGEGAAFLILEELSAAVNRDAHIYAEIMGFGSGCDAYSMVTPHPEGRGLALAMNAALHEAQLSPSAIDYIMAHGSGTLLGDASEVAAIKSVFSQEKGKEGSQKGNKPLPYMPVGSSIKPATGHLVAAAGALNVAVTALALHNQILPPTLNLHNMDPECAMDWVPHQARAARVDAALSLARGLEGHNVALTLRRVGM
jgi:3-oxoacyl-[acyl-carrier-protein] synthase II